MTPIKLSELERLAKEATQGEWWAESPVHIQYKIGGNVGSAWKISDRDYIAAANPLTISRLCEALRIAHGALEFYKGNFDGRQGTKWNSDIFYYEDNCGYTTTQDESTAKEAITKIQTLVDLS